MPFALLSVPLPVNLFLNRSFQTFRLSVILFWHLSLRLKNNERSDFFGVFFVFKEFYQKRVIHNFFVKFKEI